MTIYQEPDPAARRKAVLIVIGVGALGALCVWILQTELETLESSAQIGLLRDYPWISAGFGLLLALPLWFSAAWMLRYANAAVKSERIPPDGYPTVARVRVYTGRTAVFRARFMQILSLLIIAAGLMMPLVLFSVTSSLLETGDDASDHRLDTSERRIT